VSRDATATALDAYDPPVNTIGFTGTREGITDAQRSTLIRVLMGDDVWRTASFHHGDCVGADADFDAILRAIYACPPIESHPCTFAVMRAHCERRGPTVVHAPRRYDRRNREIVLRSATMLVCPKDMSEQRFGGTWATYRIALAEGRRVLVVWPDGRLEDRSSPLNRRGRERREATT